MNILVLCNVDLENQWGDYTRVFSLMNALEKKGHKIIIMIIRPNPKKPRVSYFKENNLDVIEIHPPSFGFSGKRGVSRHLNYLACIPTIQKESSKIISKTKIDFVYSYMPGSGSSIPSIKICSKNKIPLVLDLADMYSMIKPKMVVEKSFKKSDKILVITNYLKNDLLQKEIPESKIHVLPNGVDLSLFNSDACSIDEINQIREKFGTKKIIVFSGSLQDLNMIINSASDVIDKIPSVKYVIIGDHRDPLKSVDFWKNKVKEKNLEKHFDFLGRIPRSQIPKYLMSADVCLDSFPDEPYFAAAHPIKLLEYGACGKPVVATAVSETSKIIEHGKYGFLAKPGDFESYGNFIIELLTNEELNKKMGNDFENYVRTKFEWKKLVETIENLF